MSWCDNGVSLLRDERIAPLAVSAVPAWLWNTDATRIIWANPTGAAIFGAPSSASIAARKFDPGQPAAAQITDLAERLPANGSPITVKLRGFGAGFGRALTCRCSRLTWPDRDPAILVVASERAGPDLSLDERVGRLLAGCDQPVAAFGVDGRLIASRPIAAGFVRHGTSLAELDIDGLAREALRNGQAIGHTAHALVRLDRLGDATATVLLAAFADLDQRDTNITDMPEEAAAAAVLTQPLAPVATEAAVDSVAATESAIADDVNTAAAAGEQDRPAPTQAEKICDQNAAPVASPTATPVAVPADEAPAVPVPESATHGASGHLSIIEPVAPIAPSLPKPATAGPAFAVAAHSGSRDATAAAAVLAPVTTPVPTPAAKPARTVPRTTASERRHPLRFVWQIDAEGRFTLGSEEFVALAGPTTTRLLGRPWPDIARDLDLDPDERVAQAIGTRETWSGLTVAWPIDGSTERLKIELSGLPSFDRDRQFRGYRGFGVCRDIGQLNALARPHRPAPATTTPATVTAATDDVTATTPAIAPPSGEPEPPPLSNVEHDAFYELSRRLTHQLAHEEKTIEHAIEQSEALLSPAGDMRQLFDRLPVGVLIYRLEQLIYANRAFLLAVGHDSLDELAEAGGLDSLLRASDRTPVNAAPGKPFSLSLARSDDERRVEAELIPVLWENEAAHALLALTTPGATAAALARLASSHDDLAGFEAAVSAAQQEAAQAQAETARTRTELAELRDGLEIASDGVVLVDDAGAILSANSSAEALFGYGGGDLAGKSFVELFAPDSVDAATTCLASVHDGETVSGRTVSGRTRPGGTVSLVLSMGRIGSGDGGNGKVCAVFRDVTLWKKTENELVAAKQRAETASAAKSDLLAKISHEIRTPLNAIIGFSEVMMLERLGPMLNERYRDYAKDIHTSGGHLMSLVNDLLDLSKIEAGKLDLTLDNVSLNEIAQQCVALMQPQANRERIIVRTSLPPGLPPVLADARSVRQIALNLLSNSIKFTESGGQVIVSTALGDEGHVALRVRDNGIGMSEKDLATALEPFRQIETTIPGRAGGTGLGLPLTKALAEANRARFQIKSAPGEGTLVEVAFPVAPGR